METGHAKVTVDVIIPARNEEDCLGRCLQSLVAQQGISFQITVVDDGSTDRTRAIAESFPGVRVLSAGELKPGMTGKVNALVTGAAGSTAEWLLFTDADTFHYPDRWRHLCVRLKNAKLTCSLTRRSRKPPLGGNWR